jgi:hypothetical protein
MSLVCGTIEEFMGGGGGGGSEPSFKKNYSWQALKPVNTYVTIL